VFVDYEDSDHVFLFLSDRLALFVLSQRYSECTIIVFLLLESIFFIVTFTHVFEKLVVTVYKRSCGILE